MICDVCDVLKYNNFRFRLGPFLLTFYHEDDDKQNFKIYDYLKKLEKFYNDIPIFRFSYKEFTTIFQKYRIFSPNCFIFVDEYGFETFIDSTDKILVENTLRIIRSKLLNRKKKVNKHFQTNRNWNLRPFSLYGSRLRVNDIHKEADKSAEIQYKFPNTTAFLRQKTEKNKKITTMKRKKDAIMFEEFSIMCKKTPAIILDNKVENIIRTEPKIQPFINENLLNFTPNHTDKGLSPFSDCKKQISKITNNINLISEVNKKSVVNEPNKHFYQTIPNSKTIKEIEIKISEDKQKPNEESIKYIQNFQTVRNNVVNFNLIKNDNMPNRHFKNECETKINKINSVNNEDNKSVLDILNDKITQPVEVILNHNKPIDFVQTIPNILMKSYNK